MTAKEASAKLRTSIVPAREDIVRAKDFICHADPEKLYDLVRDWLRQHNVEAPDVTTAEGTSDPQYFGKLVHAYRIRMAFHHAVWELIVAGEAVPVPPKHVGGVNFGGGAASIRIEDFETVYLPEFRRIPPSNGLAQDTDIFLQGINCKTLHPGIIEAIDQALDCFRKGLYMPATAMLAAGAEATWTECGEAVAKKLAKTKLEAILQNPREGIGKKVFEIRKALELDGNALLKAAGQSMSKVNDAELWTTTLRDRRNALHWGKAKSFIVEHCDTANLLLAAPLHLGTLEAVRAACCLEGSSNEPKSTTSELNGTYFARSD